MRKTRAIRLDFLQPKKQKGFTLIYQQKKHTLILINYSDHEQIIKIIQ